MLGVKKALEQFKAFPEDPYVIIPNTNIELRFGEDGMIIGAYQADPPKSLRWYSDEFKAMLEANHRKGFIV